MKLVSWNVNGIRAAGRGSFINWFEEESADVVCVQETKAHPDQLTEELKHPGLYNSYWHPAEKAGYSGVGIYSKIEPLRIQTGLGIPEIDCEGRVLIAEYSNFVLINAYFPNSQRALTRVAYKLFFCEKILDYCNHLRASGKNPILCGDFNIAHKAIDLKNPKANEKNAGFLPEERAWMDHYLKQGYIDCFRHFHPEPEQYTWWSYRPGVREKNVGWRIDYFAVNSEFQDRLKNADHQPHVKGSDHCPVRLELKR